jgi:hypothetical protein
VSHLVCLSFLFLILLLLVMYTAVQCRGEPIHLGDKRGGRDRARGVEREIKGDGGKGRSHAEIL